MWMPFTHNTLGSTPSQKEDKQLGTHNTKAQHARLQLKRLKCRAQRQKQKTGRRASTKKHTKYTLVPQVLDRLLPQQGAALSKVPETALSGRQLGGQVREQPAKIDKHPDCPKNLGGSAAAAKCRLA